uniref:Uncharacterized protein n=1 Tax=Opuntia streptacantha TaxID=393608 RepID=A0A7C9AIX2_OPUST
MCFVEFYSASRINPQNSTVFVQTMKTQVDGSKASSRQTTAFIFCSIHKTCHILGLCSGDVKLHKLATSTSIPTWVSSEPSLYCRIAFTQWGISAGERIGCWEGGLPDKSSTRRMPKA